MVAVIDRHPKDVYVKLRTYPCRVIFGCIWHLSHCRFAYKYYNIKSYEWWCVCIKFICYRASIYYTLVLLRLVGYNVIRAFVFRSPNGKRQEYFITLSISNWIHLRFSVFSDAVVNLAMQHSFQYFVGQRVEVDNGLPIPNNIRLSGEHRRSGV